MESEGGDRSQGTGIRRPAGQPDREGRDDAQEEREDQERERALFSRGRRKLVAVEASEPDRASEESGDHHGACEKQRRKKSRIQRIEPGIDMDQERYHREASYNSAREGG